MKDSIFYTKSLQIIMTINKVAMFQHVSVSDYEF